MVSGIVSNALFHSSPHNSQKLLHILRFCLIDLLLNYAADFESTGLRSGLFGGHKSEVHRSDLDLIDCCTFGVKAANDAHTVWVKTACRKDLSQQNLSKLILSDTSLYNQIASDVCETNDHVLSS